MRLDVTLKQTRIIKRRTVAKEIIDKGHVFINGKNAKPSSEVKDGDIILIKGQNRNIEVKISLDETGKKPVVSFEEIK